MSNLSAANTTLREAQGLLDAATKLDVSDIMSKCANEMPKGLTETQIRLLDALDTLGPIGLCECIWDLTKEHIAVEPPPANPAWSRREQSQALYTPDHDHVDEADEEEDEHEDDDEDNVEDEEGEEEEEEEEGEIGMEEQYPDTHNSSSPERRSDGSLAHSHGVYNRLPQDECVPETPPSRPRRNVTFNGEPSSEIIERPPLLKFKARGKSRVNAEPTGEVIERRPFLKFRAQINSTVNAEPNGEVIDDPISSPPSKRNCIRVNREPLPGIIDRQASSKNRTREDGVNEESSDEIIYVQARQKKPYTKGCKSWNLILEDAERASKSRTLFYLSHLPDKLIRALIIGDLPSQMQKEEFRCTISPWVRARNTQGTYVIYIALSGIQPIENSVPLPVKPVRGMGPSPRHMMKLLDTIALYIDVGNRRSEKVSKAIDGQFGRNAAQIDHSWQRLYGGGSLYDAFHKHKLWIQSWEKVMQPYRRQMLEGDESGLDQWLPRCLPYGGLASDVGERYQQHAGRTSSRLFALIRAAMECLYPTMYDVNGFFFQVLPTVATEDVGLDECITAILVSASPWDGGLMFDHPGLGLGRKSARTGQRYLEGLRSNHGFLKANGDHDENLARSIAQYKQLAESIHQFHTNPIELRRCQQTIDALSRRLATASSNKSSTSSDRFVKESDDLVRAFEEYETVNAITETMVRIDQTTLNSSSPLDQVDESALLEALEAYEKGQDDHS